MSLALTEVKNPLEKKNVLTYFQELIEAVFNIARQILGTPIWV